MKTFKQHITTEEWVDNTNWLDDIWKNPTPKELSEYMNGTRYAFAGIIAKGDVYLFYGMHDDMEQYLESKLNIRAKDTTRFRAIVDGGKISRLGPSGGSRITVGSSTPAKRRLFFEDMVAVYKHKSLKNKMDTFEKAFAEIKKVFSDADDMEDFDQLVARHRLK